MWTIWTMGICCAKPTDKPVSFDDISKNQNGTSEEPKKENKRYTQDPTIPRNASAAEPQTPGK